MKKTLTMVLAFALVFALGVGGTLAWLTATSPEVENTFTVGDINIDLKEHTLDAEGNLTATETDKNAYEFVPGDTLKKDPFVTVKADSEKCYVFIEVTSANNMIDNVQILSWAVANNWTAVSTETNGSIVYRYNEVVDASTEAKTLPVLANNEVKVSADVTKAMVTTINAEATQPTLTFNAYAHQADNTTVDAATTAALAHFAQ